jgi:hypothetical protein
VAEHELQLRLPLGQRDDNGLFVTEGFAKLASDAFLLVDFGHHLDIFPAFGVFQTDAIERTISTQ